MYYLEPSRWFRPAAPYVYGKGRRARFSHRLLFTATAFFGMVGFIIAGPSFKSSDLALSSSAVSAAPASVPSVNPSFVVTIPDISTPLQNVLNNWAGTHTDHKWSVVVKELGGQDRQASFNPNQSFRAASMYKLFLTPKLFSVYTPQAMVDASVNVEGRGSTNLKDCVEMMLRVSDNPCGAAVGSRLGWVSANASIRKLGLGQTNLNASGGPITTASDTALLLEKIQSGQLFDPFTQQYLTDLMQNQTLRKGIPAGCAGCSVADKTGDLNFVRHDAGIVSYPGGQYILSVFTDGASYGQIAQLTSQIQSAMTH